MTTCPSKHLSVGLVTALMTGAFGIANAKGSSGPGLCHNPPLNCPTVINNTSGTLVDELVNGATTAVTLGIAYSVPLLASDDVMSFALSGPGTGANLLPFLASATLYASSASGSALFSLGSSNFDPTGHGGTAYLVPASMTQNGVTLTESVSSFEGAFSIQALNQSGAPISLKLDLTIPVSGFGQVTVTNTYVQTLVPEPSARLELAAGLGLLALVGAVRGRRTVALFPPIGPDGNLGQNEYGPSHRSRDTSEVSRQANSTLCR